MLYKDTPYKVVQYLAKLSNEKVLPFAYKDENYIRYLIERKAIQPNGKQFSITKKFEEKYKEIRKELGTRVRHQLRSIPEIKFFIDDTLDYVFKMEELFEKYGNLHHHNLFLEDSFSVCVHPGHQVSCLYRLE